MAHKKAAPVTQQKRKPGRPSKATDERKARIIELLRAGNFIDTACAASGISDETFRDWLRRSNAGEPLFAGFAVAVKEAQAAAEADAVAVIRTASIETWQAAAWFLERKHFARWGRKAEIRPDEKSETSGTVYVVRGGEDAHGVEPQQQDGRGGSDGLSPDADAGAVSSVA